VKVRNVYVGEALRDLGASGNLMPYATFKKIGGLGLRACFVNVGLEDGTTSKPLDMVRNMNINIDGFKFEIDVIVSKDKKAQNCPLILGRSFMTTTKSLVDLDLNVVFIRSSVYYRWYKVTTPHEDYNLDMEVADDWDAIKAFIKGSSDESEP